MYFNDLKGQKFNRLTVIKYVGNDKYNAALWLCRCDCGNEKVIKGSLIKKGHTQSCGCLNKEKLVCKPEQRYRTHGMKKTRFYKIWSHMKVRCDNENYTDYNRYGGRGINYNLEWSKFECFKEDMYQTYLDHTEIHGEKNTTLERIDVNGNYTKENCRWATWREQSQNRTNSQHYEYEGEILTLPVIAERCGIKYPTLKHRIKYQGQTLEEAIKKG